MSDAAVLAALRGLLPPGFGCGWAAPGGEQPLMPGEALPGAVPGRLREFAGGRAAARAAMAEIGLLPAAIPHGADRAPVWPPGLIGSITHTGTDCLAVVARQGPQRGIGIDMEPDLPLTRDLWPTVLRDEEADRLRRVPDCKQGSVAKLHFVVKEAVYKAQYTVTREMIDFHALRLTLVPGGFEAAFERDVASLPAGTIVRGRLVVTGATILATALL